MTTIITLLAFIALVGIVADIFTALMIQDGTLQEDAKAYNKVRITA